MCPISWSHDNICPVWRVRRLHVHLPHTWWGEGALDKQWWEWRLAVNKLSDSITIPISGWLTPGQQTVTHRMMISWPLLSRSQSQDTHSSQTKVMTKVFWKSQSYLKTHHIFFSLLPFQFDQSLPKHDKQTRWRSSFCKKLVKTYHFVCRETTDISYTARPLRVRTHYISSF